MSGKIKMREIHITRIEGPLDGAIPAGDSRRFACWRDAESYLHRICLSIDANQAGFDRVQFAVKFDDGESFVGRYGATNPQSRVYMSPDLRARMREYAGFMACIDVFRPQAMSAKRWRAHCALQSASQRRQWQGFLETYDV